MLEKAITLYGHYVAAIIFYQLGKGAGNEDIEEMTANTFLALWEERHQIHGERLRGWLAVVARRQAMAYYRKTRAEVMEEEAFSHIDDKEAEQEYRRIELRMVLDEALRALGEEERNSIIDYYFKGEDVETIAEKSGIRPAAVRKRLERGRKKLKATLEERGVELEDRYL